MVNKQPVFVYLSTGAEGIISVHARTLQVTGTFTRQRVIVRLAELSARDNVVLDVAVVFKLFLSGLDGLNTTRGIVQTAELFCRRYTELRQAQLHVQRTAQQYVVNWPDRETLLTHYSSSQRFMGLSFLVVVSGFSVGFRNEASTSARGRQYLSRVCCRMVCSRS